MTGTSSLWKWQLAHIACLISCLPADVRYEFLRGLIDELMSEAVPGILPAANVIRLQDYARKKI